MSFWSLLRRTEQLLSFLIITWLRETIRNYHELCKDNSRSLRAICPQVPHGSPEQATDGAPQQVGLAKQTKITIETNSLLVMHGTVSLRRWCPECAAEGEVIPFDGIGVISNLTPSEVQGWLEGEAIHHSYGPDGTRLICLNSLLKRLQKPKTD